MKYCKDCGALLTEYRAVRCPACRAKREKALREQRKLQNKREVICEMCKKPFITYRKGVKFCPDCCHQAGREKQKQTLAARKAAREQEALDRQLEQMNRKKDPLPPEPTGNPNSLEHVMWELAQLNRKRRQAGQSPVSYGKYVSTRPEIPYKKRK